MAAAIAVTEIARAAAKMVADLGACKRRWALVGGLAVSARAEPRNTRDVDIAVAVSDDADAEGLVGELMKSGWVVEAAVEQIGTGRLATIRLLPPRARTDSTIVDLLFASSGIEHEIVARATELEAFPGVMMPVASIGDLIAMKVLAHDERRRPHDAIDLRALAVAAGPADLEVAREAVETIIARGCHRGRDLVALLDQALARYRD
jgi:hypothetical protein